MAMPTFASTRYDMNAADATATTSGLGNHTLDSLAGVLKDVYLPGLNNTLYFDNKFTRMIQAEAGTLDATGRKLISAFETQRSAGVGPMEEGGGFVKSVPVNGFQGHEWLKYSNMYVELSGPALATVQSGNGSYIDILDKHISSLIDSAKLDVERILMGCGDGRLANITEPTSATAVYGVTGPAFFDTQFLEDGMMVDVMAAITTSATTQTLRDYDSSKNAEDLYVTAHTTGNKRTSTSGTITLADSGVTNTAITKGTAATYNTSNGDIITGDWIVRANAYGYQNEQSVLVCLEQNGLCNLVSDGLTSSSRGYYDTNGWLPSDEDTPNYKLSWNVDRTSQTVLQSISHNVNDELDEENLLTVLIEAENQHQANPNLLVVSPRAMLKYFLNSRDDRRFNTMTAMEWTGGYTGLGIQLGDKKLMVTSLSSVPVGIGFMINTADFAFMRPPGWNGYRWLSGAGGGLLTQKEASDNQFATAVDYWQFVCKNPGKQIKLYNISE